MLTFGPSPVYISKFFRFWGLYISFFIVFSIFSLGYKKTAGSRNILMFVIPAVKNL